MPYASGSHKWKYQMVSARSVRVIGVSFCSGIPRVASCNISNACMHQNLIRSRMILIAPHLNLSGLVFARRFWNKGSPAWIQTFSRKPSDQASVLLQKKCLCAGTAPTKCTANLTSSYRKNMAQWTYYLQKALDFLIDPYQRILPLYKKTRACLQKMYVGLPQKHTDSLQKSSVPSSKLLTVQLYLCNRKQSILRLSAEVFQSWSIWCGKQCQTKKTRGLVHIVFVVGVCELFPKQTILVKHD